MLSANSCSQGRTVAAGIWGGHCHPSGRCAAVSVFRVHSQRNQERCARSGTEGMLPVFAAGAVVIIATLTVTAPFALNLHIHTLNMGITSALHTAQADFTALECSVTNLVIR